MLTSKDQRYTPSISQGHNATSSFISTSSDSYLSMSSSENNLSTKDQLIFDTTNTDPFNQLLDDLTIIDDFIPDYNDFENEIEIHYERQVADAARNVAQKQAAVYRLCQFEHENVINYETFLACYMDPLTRWVNDPSNSIIFQRFPDICSMQALLELYEVIRILAKAHQEFYEGLKERLAIWGPTQFLSDLFSDFYEKSVLYENYFSLFPDLIITIDALYKKSSTFSTFIDDCMFQVNMSSIKDILFYLKNPLLQIHDYLSFISGISTATDPTHPDYKPLISLHEKFSSRGLHWKPIIKDRLSHIRVLEASRSIQDNPAIVTSSRRLLMSGLLIRVDLSSPQSTQDIRTYLLYNDLLIHTQKLKTTSVQNNQTEKLIYKGSIPLKHAEVLPLSSKVISKISATKKAPSLAFMRNKSDAKDNNKATPVYGFELQVNDIVAESQTRMDNRYVTAGSYALYTTVPGDSTLNSKKSFIMRTQNEAEQNAWMHLLNKVIKELSRKK